MSVKILNSKILEFQKFRIGKLTNVNKSIVNFINCKIPKISEIVQFRKLANYKNL